MTILSALNCQVAFNNL